MVDCLLKEFERSGSALIGLREHRRAGLNQRVPSCELRGLLGHVHVGDAASRSFEVGLVGRKEFGGKAEAALFGAVGGAEGCNILEGLRDRTESQGARA